MERTRRLAPRPGLVLLAVSLAAIGWLAIARPSARPGPLLRDFNAFYCAGRALAHGADPYRAEPLGECERRAEPPPLASGLPGLAMPAPLPPYALTPFVALARLPYPTAAAGWTLVLLASLGAAAGALRSITRLPLLPLLAALALTDGYASLCLGQLAPVAVAAICLGGLLLERGRDEAASVVISLSMLEPHVGLPACVALFVWRARSRATLLAAGVAATLGSFALAGVPVTLEYFRDVLPAHALSEIANEKQFSLSYVLRRLGSGDALALHAGEAWYLAMLVTGVAVARPLARRLTRPAALAMFPPAFALLGGPFVHVVQMAAALPAALVLFASVQPPLRRWVGLGIVALAIPWIQFVSLGPIFIVLAGLTAAVLTAALVDARPLAIAAGAACAMLFLEALGASLGTRVGEPVTLLLAHYDPRALAEASWRLYVDNVGAANERAFDLARLPTLAGLLIVLGIAVAAARPRERSGASAANRAVRARPPPH